MALNSLAGPTDLPQTWWTSPDAQRALDIASAAIRDAAGVPISQTTATVRVDGTENRLLRLPGPIASIAAVTLDGDALAESVDYKWIAEGLWRQHGWASRDCFGAPSAVVVTYTFGLSAIPADIINLCAQLATAWLQHEKNGGGSMAGVTSVRLDDAQENYTDEAAGQVSPVYIPKITRDWLAARFGGPGVTVVETI